MRIANENLLSSATQSMAADFTLRPLYLGHICNYSIQLVFTGSPVGVLKLQCSDDPGQPDGGNNASNIAVGVTNWTDISDSSQSITAAGNHTWTVANAGYNWVRVVWTADGGGSGGTVTSARGNIKGV